MLNSQDQLELITKEFEKLVKGGSSQTLDKIESIEQMMKITAEASVEGSKLVAGLSKDEAQVSKRLNDLEQQIILVTKSGVKF